jgi:hypothetical protein
MGVVDRDKNLGLWVAMKNEPDLAMVAPVGVFIKNTPSKIVYTPRSYDEPSKMTLENLIILTDASSAGIAADAFSP